MNGKMLERLMTIRMWCCPFVFLFLGVRDILPPWGWIPFFAFAWFNIFVAVLRAQGLLFVQAMWAVNAIGFGMNLLAIAVNGGRMPVLGEHRVKGIWKPVTSDTHMRFLCDIHNKTSLGDFVIFASAIGMLLFYVTWSAIGQMRKKSQQEVRREAT